MDTNSENEISLTPPEIKEKEPAEIASVNLLLEKSKKLYIMTYESFSNRRNEMKYLSDMFFVIPVLKSLRLASKYAPVYFYIMTYKGEIVKTEGLPFNSQLEGVAHAEDIAYLWKNNITNITAEKDKVFRNRLIKLWSNFVTFGNPTPTTDHYLQNITWPTVTGEDDIKYLQIGEDLRVLRNYRIEYMQFWDRLYEKYAQRPFTTY